MNQRDSSNPEIMRDRINELEERQQRLEQAMAKNATKLREEGLFTFETLKTELSRHLSEIGEHDGELKRLSETIEEMRPQLSGVRTIVDRFVLEVSNGVESMKAAEERHAGYYRELFARIEKLSMEPDRGRKNEQTLEQVDKALGDHSDQMRQIRDRIGQLEDKAGELFDLLKHPVDEDEEDDQVEHITVPGWQNMTATELKAAVDLMRSWEKPITASEIKLRDLKEKHDSLLIRNDELHREKADLIYKHRLDCQALREIIESLEEKIEGMGGA